MSSVLPKQLLTIPVLILLFAFILVGVAKASQATTSRPGWGFGVSNNIHTGPSGISVRPAREPRASGLSFRPIPEDLLEQILEYIFSTPGIQD